LVEKCDGNIPDEALRWAASDGHLDVVKYLVSKGANVHVRDDEALLYAAGNGHLQVVKYLVEDHGADVHAHYDLTLHWATENGHLEVVKYLKTYHVLQFTIKHIHKKIQIEKLNGVLKVIRALPPSGVDYLYALQQFNHLKNNLIK
jgi:ankyrin repeat protein